MNPKGPGQAWRMVTAERLRVSSSETGFDVRVASFGEVSSSVLLRAHSESIQ